MIVAASVLAGRLAAADNRPVRIIDELVKGGAAEKQSRIDGTWRRVLPVDTTRFTLHDAPEKPRLRFGIGLEPAREMGRVRFEVLLERADGPPVVAYSRDLATSGWIEEDVDLDSGDAKETRLLFRRTLLEGPSSRLVGAHFAEPILLARQPPRRPAVVLISLDTLRADRVGAYGYRPARTPTLDRLATEGVWYANAYSASTWTYPSHASLLSGLYPISLPPVETPGTSSTRAARPRPILAERFRQAGYLTAGFTGGGFMSASWGYHEGFDTYFEFMHPKAGADRCPPERFDGPNVFARAARWAEENARHPFFLFVHTYDAHDRCEVWPEGQRLVDPWPDPGPSGRERVSRYYDDRIAAVDTLVAGFVRKLDALGLSDRVVIAVTSDHGEALWEHGFFGHGCTKPFEALVRVPLIVCAPGHSMRRGVDQPVSAVDVAPSLLALAGVPRPADQHGYVLPGLGPGSRPATAPIFVQCEDHLAVRVGHHKLLTTREPAGADDLYDLARDPGEEHPLVGASGCVTELLRRHAAQYWGKGSAASGGVPVERQAPDEQTRERLRALGYVK